MPQLHLSLNKKDNQSRLFRLFIFFFLLFVGFKGFSQSQKTYFIPDSLKNMTYKELYKQHNIYQDKGDSIKQLFYSKMYLRKAKNENDTILMANGYSQHIQLSESEIAIKYTDSIISLTKNINHNVYPGYSYMIKGMMYYALANYNKALDNYLIAQNYALKNNNKQHLSYINEGIGEIKMFWGDYNEALLHIKSHLKYLTKNNKTGFDQYNYFPSLSNLANCYIQLKQLDSATLYNKKGLKKSTQKKDEYWYQNFVKQSGYILYYKNNFKAALDSIRKGSVSDESSSEHLNSNYYIGSIYNKLNQKNKALYHFKKADSIFDKNPDNILEEVRNVQEYFIKYYVEKKNANNQLKYINRLLHVDSIMDSYKKELNETITKEYDRPRLLAEKQNIIDSLERKKTKTRILIGSLIAGLIILFGFTIRFYYLQNVHKKHFKNLVNNNEIEKKEVVIKTKQPLQGVSQDVANSILKHLELFEKGNTFLSKDITLTSLAKTYNTNSSYLSKVINHYKQKNFSAYLTDLRIEHSINTLKTDKLLRSYTIKAIANDMGFSNSESFSKAFYKKTGIYPSFFIKQFKKLSK